MTLDRKDLIIAGLGIVIAFQLFAITLMGGALIYVHETAISVHEADQILMVTERVLAISDVCVSTRVTADQSIMRNLMLPGGDVDGEIRYQSAGAGSGLRELRVAAGGPAAAK